MTKNYDLSMVLDMSDSSLITPVTVDSFPKILDQAGVYLVDFYADWCGPCKAMAPVLENLAAEMKEVKFLSVDVDAETELAQQFGITAMPTFYLLRLPGDGSFDLQRDTVTVMRGAAPALDFKMAIEKALEK